MVALLHALLWDAVKLALVACAGLYTALVLMSYRQSQGAGYTPHFTLSDPARSAQRLFVWLGVKAVSGVVRVGRSTFEVLCEASADVGDWIISKSNPAIREKVRSRFL